MAQQQTLKRWTGFAKIIKPIEKPDNYYYWVRVTEDLHGDSEFLEGACFFREAMGHGWMKKTLKKGDVIAVQLPPKRGDSSWMMYCAPNHDQPPHYKPMIREFMDEAERREKEWEAEIQRRTEVNSEKEKLKLERENAIQSELDIQEVSKTRQGVRVQCTLTHEEIRQLQKQAAANNINVSDHRWRGQYIQRLIRKALST